MGMGKIGLIRVFFILLLVYLTPQTLSSEDQNRTCNPSRCGFIANISHPFRLRDDQPHCGLRPFELACENNVPLLHLHSATYQVLAINYHNYTIRLRDPGIREANCSSLPKHSLSRSNFTDTYNTSFEYEYDSNDPFVASPGSAPDSDITFDHVIYLNCSDPVRDDAGYVDTAACVDWGSKGGGGGHVYAVAGDLEADRLKPKCRVKSVATIDWYWSSFLKGENYSYAEIHRVLSRGFELSWWPEACTHHHRCGASEGSCFFDIGAQKLVCSKAKTYCSRFCLFDGNMANLSPRLKAFLVGILVVLPSSEAIHELASFVKSSIESHFAAEYAGDLISVPVAFTLGEVTAIVSTAFILRFLVGMVFLFILMIYTYRRRHLSMYESIEDFIRLDNLHPIRYSYKDLKTITKGFKTKIGEGGFAIIYKGRLKSGFDVAVKMLGKKSKATCQDFINEVATIGRTHHINVVHLLGFCVEGKKRALIYEFMPNGSLDKHIFFKDGHVSLSYHKIYEISLGVARGIAYLHHGCNMKILHFDIKPNNILLDENLTPKISDFGLAKLYAIDDSIATLTAAKGTLGYMAPELFYKNIGKVSHKTDVYSFGKLLMEMASRRRNINPHVEHSSQVYFPSWIYDQFDEEKDIELEDLTEEEKALAKKMFIVALWCIQFGPANRPSMNKVIEMLEVDDVSSLEMPPKPSIYPENEQSNYDQATSSFSQSSSIASH